MRYLIVLNENAGQAGKTPPGGAPEELREAFARAGIDADVHIVKPGRIEQDLRALLGSRPDAVIVGGGDGTVRSAAAVLADTGIPLGVLPMGTFNHFAKDLQIPASLAEAVPALAGGTTRDVDLGEVNGHVFINNCSIGAYAQAVRRRDALRHRRGLGKWWAMVTACYQEFRLLRRLRLRIGVEPIRQAQGRQGTGGPASLRAASPRLVRTPLVVVGNNRYSGRMLDQHLRARLDEGQLWLYTVRARRHFAVLRLMLQSCVRRLDEVDALDAEPARELVIESDCGRLPVAADGELLDVSAPLHFRIRPGALRVLAPGPGREARGDGRREEQKAETSRPGAVLASWLFAELALLHYVSPHPGACAPPLSRGDPNSRFENPLYQEGCPQGGVCRSSWIASAAHQVGLLAMTFLKHAPAL